MKTIIKHRILLILCLVISLSIHATAKPLSEKDDKVNAQGLVEKTERALAFVVKSGQSTSDTNLKRSNKAADPFWSSVKKLNASVEKLNNYLFLKDDSFYKELSGIVTIKEEVITTYELLGANDPKVKEGLDKVSASVDLLYENYSKEAQRMKEGEELTESEKKKLDELKSQNKELQSKLDGLEAKVGNNKKMIKKLKKVREKSNQVANCGHNSAAFFFAMSAMNMMNGWMWGCHYWWGPWGGWYPGFYYGYVDIYVGIYDDYAYDWGYLDGAIDSYDYDLEVELEQVEMDELDDYLYETQPEAETFDEPEIDTYDQPEVETYDQPEAGTYEQPEVETYDQQDQMNDTYQQDYYPEEMVSEPVEQMQPQMEYEPMDNYQSGGEMDYMGDSMDFDY